MTSVYGQLLEVAAAQLAEVDAAARRYIGPDDTEEISREKLLRRVSAGQAIVVDVRPRQSMRLDTSLERSRSRWMSSPRASRRFRQDRARGVVPRRLLRLLPRRRPLLTSRGYRAVGIADGILEWQLAGKPVSTNAG